MDFSYPKITSKRITAAGGIDSSEDIFIALSSLNICRISCGTFSFSLQTKVQGQHLSEVSTDPRWYNFERFPVYSIQHRILVGLLWVSK